ncbi:MAG: hypothetical protein AAB526_03695, partial [Patescibacteria group bacterium]
MTQQTKICQNCQKEFTVEPEDFEFYEKIKVPTPTFCPECRLQRRLNYYNVDNIYKRKCDFTGDDIISIYHKNSLVKVYKNKIWWSDEWDALDYRLEIDFKKSFLSQLQDLIRSVPQMSIAVSEYNTNSDYTNAAGGLKNCYLIFFADYCENVSYSHYLAHIKDSIDILWGSNSENSYDSIDINKCYKAFFSQDCINCHNIYFSKDLVGCNDCFMCISLRNKSYCIQNQQYIKEEYLNKLDEFNIGSYNKIEYLKFKTENFQLNYPKKFIHGKNNYNSTGDYVYHSKNAYEMHDVVEVEDSKWCNIMSLGITRDSYDYSGWGNNAQLIYECSGVGECANNLKFCTMCWPNNKDLEYCFSCMSSSNLFGCIGLRHKQYCILNKQYTKEEYEELVPK